MVRFKPGLLPLSANTKVRTFRVFAPEVRNGLPSRGAAGHYGLLAS